MKITPNTKESLKGTKEFFKSLLTGVLVFLTLVATCGLFVYLFQFVWFLLTMCVAAMLVLLAGVGHMAREIWKHDKNYNKNHKGEK